MDSVQVIVGSNGKADVRVSAIVTERNHTSLIVITEIAGETISDSLDIVFDTKGSRSAARKVGATATEGKEIDIQAYYDALPHTSDSNYVVAYEQDKHPSHFSTLSAASVEDDADVPDTILVDNITYLMPDGTESEPFSGIEYYIPNTGGGEPLPGEFEGVQPDSGGLSTQANCGVVRTYTTFMQTINGLTGPVPEGTYVRVVDFNGSLADQILDEGFISASGDFWYNLNKCDTSTSWDYAKPDIYFILETRTLKYDSNFNVISDGLTASHGTFARRHWWRTGTYYEVDQSNRPSQITVVGANAEAVNTQRLWYKVSKARNWERQATGVSFPADVLYPVFTYFGAAVVSRAALGQIQIVPADAQIDNVIFHEYGHLITER